MNEDLKMAWWKTFFVSLGAIASEVTLNDLVSFASLIFVVAQIFLLIPKYQEMFKNWRKKKRDSTTYYKKGGCNADKK